MKPPNTAHRPLVILIRMSTNRGVRVVTNAIYPCVTVNELYVQSRRTMPAREKLRVGVQLADISLCQRVQRVLSRANSSQRSLLAFALRDARMTR